MEILKFDKSYCQNDKIELKKASGGFPSSFYETYSSFSNTKGGYIYLGISELENKTIISSKLSLEQVNKLKIDMFNGLNNPQKVNYNLIDENDVLIKEFDGYPVLEVKVNRAPNEYKPIYINNNVLTGTYRRNFEGDYRCTPAEIRAMLRDAEIKNQDLKCLEDLDLKCLSDESINSYKNRLLSLRPEHIFASLNLEHFLEYLGAIRIGTDGKYHPTSAGLLMF